MSHCPMHLMIGGLLIFVASFRLVSKLLNQPVVVGEISAGLVIGLLFSESTLISSDNFSKNFSNSLLILGNLGLVLMVLNTLFHVDNKSNKNIEPKYCNLLTLSNIIPSFIAGGLLSILYLYFNPAASPVAFVLLTATSISISAVPVLARILSELGIHHTAIGRISFKTACWTDAIGWMFVGITLAINAGSGILRFTVERFGIMVGILVLLLIIKKLIIKYVVDLNSTTKILFITLLIVTGVTEGASLHLVLGAFFVGLVFASEYKIVRVWKKHTQWITDKFFSPFFFVLMGMNLSFSGGISIDQVLWGLAFLLVSILSKIGPLYWTARRLGFTTEESSLLAFLLNTRGLMEIVILTVGLQTGIYDSKQFTIFIMVAIATTLICLPICKTILRRMTQSSTSMEQHLDLGQFVGTRGNI